MFRLIASIAALASLVASPSARAQDSAAPGCVTDARGLLNGPLPVGFRDADWGVPLRACPMGEVRAGVQGSAIVDLPSRYGAGRVAGIVRVGLPLGDLPLEAFASLEPVRYQTVIRSFTAESLGLGHSTVGLLGGLVDEGGFALSAYTRLGLPTATDLYQTSFPFQLDVGITAASQLTHFRLHAWLIASAAWSTQGSAADRRSGVQLGAGAIWTPASVLALVLEVRGGLGNRRGLRMVEARAAVRLVSTDLGGLELAVAVPLVGEHALAEGAFSIAGTLAWLFRFDRRSQEL